MISVEKMQEANTRYVKFLVIILLAVHFCLACIGWQNSLLDRHGFRQSQTAITAYYFVKDGFRLDYETPIFGAPWVMPMEFPLYQGIVALFVRMTGWPLDQAGRLVSLFFFYAGLAALYRLMTALTASRVAALSAVSLALVCPVYIFWSRTFMIESTALCFSLYYLWFLVRSNKAGAGCCWMYLAMLAGCLAGLAKVTTFALALVLGGLFSLSWWISQGKAMFSRESLVQLAVKAVCFAAVPVAAAMTWNTYADTLKATNPLSAFLSSKSLSAWNFGTWQQRLAGDFHHIPMFVLWLALAGAVAVMIFLAGRWRWQTAFFLVAFLAGPVVFVNLFTKHGYYWYANTMFFLAALALAAESLMSSPKLSHLMKRVLIPLTATVMLGAYAVVYLPWQFNNQGADFVSAARMVGRQVPSDGVLLCYGLGYDSSFPYYAGRKALMLTSDQDLHEAAVAEVLANTGRDNIKALVAGPAVTKTSAELKKIAGEFGLTRQVNFAGCQVTAYLRP